MSKKTKKKFLLECPNPKCNYQNTKRKEICPWCKKRLVKDSNGDSRSHNSRGKQRGNSRNNRPRASKSKQKRTNRQNRSRR